MFETLKVWRNETSGVVHGPAEGADEEDRRGSERFWFGGAEVFLFMPDDQSFRLRLKDVSCTGVSGLTDAPVSIGDLAMIQFEETLMPAAHVTWTRGATVGFKLVNAMPVARLRRIADRHEEGDAWSPAMRAGSDLGNWWTDVDEVERGRRAAVPEAKPKRSRRKA